MSRERALALLDGPDGLHAWLEALHHARRPGGAPWELTWGEALEAIAGADEGALRRGLLKYLHALQGLPAEALPEAAARAQEALGEGTPGRRRVARLTWAFAELEAERARWGDPVTDALRWALDHARPRVGRVEALAHLQERCAPLPEPEALRAAFSELPERAPRAAGLLQHLQVSLPLMLEMAE